ncbi:hypothetical protein ABC502_07855 [Alkalimonas sp. NCh-2]|uniref:hypothetical protein n=1 Tax=Alkalimonas sp. NCh-2 TaxID=3144846 RepID=UPI0031F60658
MFVDANDKSTMADSLGRFVRWTVIDQTTGNEVDKVVRCDDEAGVLTRLVTDQHGNVLLNGRKDDTRLITVSGSFSLVAHAR